MKKTLLILTILLTMALLAGCAQKTTPPAVQDNTQNAAPGTNNQTPPAGNEQPSTPTPSSPSAKTIFPAPIPNVGNAVIKGAENSITITFKNDLTSPITLPLTGEAAKYSKSECETPTVYATYEGKFVEARVTEIKSGDTFTVTWDCKDLLKVPAAGTEFSADLKFEYMPTSTGLIRSKTGTVLGVYQ